MTSLYFSELNKLKNSQKQLERFQSTIIEQLSKEQNPESQQLIEYFKASRLACDDTNCKIEIQDIIDKVKYVQKAVILEDGNNIPDLELFQEDLINVLNHIQDLKAQSQVKVKELCTTQNQLNEDVKLYTERLCLWTEQLKLDSYTNQVHSKVDTSNNDLPNDVKKFMDFVKISHGHENGWSFNDHHLFLKLRKKFSDVNELASNLHEMLPDISLEEVKKHYVWYVKYLKLKEKNINAIESWKKLKKDVHATDTNSINQCENSEESEKTSLKLIKTIEQKTDDRKKIREEIENWKKEREISKKIEQTKKYNERKEFKIKEKRREEQNLIKKEMVKKWKEEMHSLEEEKKKCEEMKKNIEQHVRYMISVANKMIKCYQIRDKDIYNKYIKSTEKLNAPERKTKSNYELSRDPKRLFRPTQQWINRFLDNNEDNPSRPVNFIGRIPKLQKPSWRKNLN